MDIKSLSMFVHDLKQPIDVMASTFDCLYAFSNCEEMDNLLNIGTEHAIRSRRTINNICDIAKNENKTVEINCFAMNIREFINMYAERLAPYLNKNNVSFVVKCDEGDFVCDFDMLTKILNDIVSNAVKYNNKEEKEIKLTITREEGNIIIEIADNGMGIPEEEVEHVTEFMYRATNARRIVTTGSGLGLNLVAGLIKTLKGRIDIKSKVDVGTTVTITIPEGRITTLASGDIVLKSMEKEALDLIFSDIVTKYCIV